MYVNVYNLRFLSLRLFFVQFILKLITDRHCAVFYFNIIVFFKLSGLDPKEMYRGFYQPCGEKSKLRCCSHAIKMAKNKEGLYTIAFPKINIPSDASEMKLQVTDRIGTISEEVVLKLNGDNPCGTKMPLHHKIWVRQAKGGGRTAFVIFKKPLTPSPECQNLFKDKYTVHPKNKLVLVNFTLFTLFTL